MKEDNLNIDVLSVLMQEVLQEVGDGLVGDVATDHNVPREESQVDGRERLFDLPQNVWVHNCGSVTEWLPMDRCAASPFSLQTGWPFVNSHAVMLATNNCALKDRKIGQDKTVCFCRSVWCFMGSVFLFCVCSVQDKW